MKRPEVLFVLPDLSGGGAERVTLNLVGALQHDGVKAGLYLFEEKGDFLSQADSATTEFCYTASSPASKRINYFKVIRDLARCAGKYDVIVGALEHKSITITALAAFLAGKKMIAWVHKDIAYYYQQLSWFKKIIYRTIVKRVFGRAEVIVCVSKGASESFKQMFPDLHDRILSIYNPVNVLSVQSGAKKGLPDSLKQVFSKPVILSIGRLEWQKGFDDLIQVHEALIRKGCDHHLLIIGEGRLREELEKLVTDKGLDGSVFMPGFMDPYPLLKQSAVVVLSSRYEGLPTVVVEAMSVARPVVAFDCPSGPAELLESYPDGVLVPPGQYEDMAFAINKMLDTPVQAEPVAPDVLSAFDPERVRMEWDKLLTRVVAEK